MQSNRSHQSVAFAAGLLAACLSFPWSASGQGSSSPTSNSMTQMDGRQANDQATEAYLRQNLGDPKEEAAYQAFHKTTGQSADKKIRLGNAFLAKYPSDRYTEAVYEELSQTYYDNKDLANFYVYSDKALSLFPDDVYLLALRGWVIPRAFTPEEPDADKKLEQAEADERRALDLISKMPKPAGVTDEQFAQFKTGESAVAHSGLGLAYFRKEQYGESAKELQNAIQSEANPDMTDVFVLGADFENLHQFKEAADAFNRCAQIASPMQDRCKEYASSALKETAGVK